MFRKKIRTIEFRQPYEAQPVPIVGHAAATLPEAMGELTRVLILDTSSRQDIDEYVRIHEESCPGDVQTTWGRRPDNSNVYQLLLEVIRPVEILIYLEFPFPAQMSSIDHIVQSEKVCIQPGRPGDKLSATYERTGRVIMEIPEMGFRSKWDDKLRKFYIRDFQRSGMRRKDAELAADSYIEQRRELMRYKVDYS